MFLFFSHFTQTDLTTVAHVKAASEAHVSTFAPVEAAPETTEAAETTEVVAETAAPVGTDPTVAHAASTEIDAAGETAPLTNGHTEPAPEPAPPANTGVSDGAANAAAESQWDSSNNNDLSASHEDWVKVPRNPTETETGLTATPAEAGNTQSWADEQPDHPPQVGFFSFFSPLLLSHTGFALLTLEAG